MDPNAVLNRLLRLARLDTTVFEEVRDDANETIPAIVIAVVSCFLSGLGLFLWWHTVPPGTLDSLVVNVLLLGTIFTAALYGAWIVVSYVVITQLFKAQGDLMSMIRTMGYGALPMAATLLMFIPVIYPVFVIVPIGLLMIFSIYAIQTCTDAEPGQVVMASLAGFAVMVLVLGFIATAQSYGKTDYAVGIFGFLPKIP